MASCSCVILLLAIFTASLGIPARLKEDESINAQLELQKLAGDNQELQSLINSLQRDISELRDHQAVNYVGFTVYLTSDTDFNVGDRVNFDGIVSNIGDAYSGGIFTCPVSGYYFFTLTDACRNNGVLRLQIVRDTVGTLVGTFCDRSAEDSGTNQVVSDCNEGETVYVTVSNADGTMMGGRDNAFSGYLINIANPLKTATNHPVSSRLLKQNPELYKQVRRSQSRINRLKERYGENDVGFTAYVSGDREYSDGATVLFDVIVSNDGGGYSPTSGQFVCPVSGFYYFSLTSTCRNNGVLRLDLMKAGSTLVSGFCDRSAEDSGSNAVVTDCAAGEAVYVLAGDASGTLMGGHFNSFMGHLISL